MREEVELLEDHAGLAADGVEVADVVRHFDAVDDDAPALVLFETVDGPQEGRLAGAGRPEHDDDLPALDPHVDVPQHAEVAEPFVHALVDDDVVALLEGQLEDVALAHAVSGSGLVVLHCGLLGRYRRPTPRVRSIRRLM